ncbi:Pkg21D [Symbiodinium necroappetens]|uniref:cGMP-dependent protein kinase n=1 Tax=Symbiodinium necroappetens TaxID=1628268 RepID=A0A812M4Z8_9DINO|nr:Pkg21D [Symbiodinium necroappetens]
MEPSCKAALLAALSTNRFLAVLNDDELLSVVHMLEVIRDAAGLGLLLEEGKEPDSIYVVQEGSLNASVAGKLSAVLGVGACVGIEGVLRGTQPQSVSVGSPSAVLWRADAAAISRLLEEKALKAAAETRKFIDRVRLFDFLPEEKKVHLPSLTVHHEVLHAGDRALTQGEIPLAIFIVKTGRCHQPHCKSFIAENRRRPNKKRELSTRMWTYLPGEVIGAGAYLFGRLQSPARTDVTAEKECTLLSLNLKQLVQTFGDDLDECLQRAFMVFGLNQLPFLAGLTAAQKQVIVKAMEVKHYRAAEQVSVDVQFAMVFDGTLLVQQGTGPILELGFAEHYLDSTLFSAQGDAERADDELKEASDLIEEEVKGATRLTGGASGVCLATLAAPGAAKAFKEMGLSPVYSAEDTNDIALEVLQARRVSVLRHLSGAQIERLVKLLVPRVYASGASIFEQGEIGTAFYIVASGQVQVFIDGKPVRTLARHGHFGERALLFEGQRRTASVRVRSHEAELWCLEKVAFEEVLTDHLREEIMRRIEIQDSQTDLKDLCHVRVIGIGGFGHVRLVEHRRTKLRYALKQVKKVDGRVPENVRRECELLAEMDHPFILDMLQVYETTKSYYILMEYIMGGTLRTVLQAERTLRREAACFYAGSLIMVLEVLHDRNIVYRDLKPENVMVDARGYVKLIDFGIAKRLDEDGRTFTCVGTAHYMAPEAILSRREGYGTEVDTWSLGVLLFECLCGQHPFGAFLNEQQEVFEAVLKQELAFPEAYQDPCGRRLLQEMLEKSPQNRLGAGVFGWDDVKEHDFLAWPGDVSLFDCIVERMVHPPHVPKSASFVDCSQELTFNDWHEEKEIVRSRRKCVTYR